jgi:pyridoxamine 5'-phosphate oxidase
VRVRGPVSPIDDARSDAYFASRARESQIGAWASQQSQPLDSRETFEAATAAIAQRYTGEVPRPPHWGGYALVPQEIEFWADRPFRLHDRVRFTRDGSGGWDRQRLYP